MIAELAPQSPPLRCCRRALVEGLLLASASGGIEFVTTRLVAARVALQVLHRDGVLVHVERVAAPRHARYRIVVPPLAAATAASRAGPPPARRCCRRARVRGAFLASGHVLQSDGVAHLEIGCASPEGGAVIVADLAELAVSALSGRRRGRTVITVRSVGHVGRALSSMGAQAGRLLFEEGRVVRELRADVNRRINAETANLERTVRAGAAQLEAIQTLRSEGRLWERLPPAVRAAALLREQAPDADLATLARRAGCSRPAIAGRLRRLLEGAELLERHGRW